MTLKTFKPSQSQPSRGICIYGRGGVGKSTMMGTMPGKMLLIDVPQLEGGTEVLDGKDNIDIHTVITWDDVENVFKFLESGKHEYKSVALDTVSALQVLAKRKIIKERPLDAAPHKLTLPEIGQIAELCGELIYKFRTLPLFTIWLAQERKFGNEDEGGGSTVIGPAVYPSVLSALLPSMMMVARLRVVYDISGHMERQLFIAPSPDCYTKVRTRPGIKVPTATRTLDLRQLIRYFAGSPDATIDMVEDNEQEVFDFELDDKKIGVD